MAYAVAGLIWIIGMGVAFIVTWSEGMATAPVYSNIPTKIAIGVTVFAGLIALTHHHIPSW